MRLVHLTAFSLVAAGVSEAVWPLRMNQSPTSPLRQAYNDALTARSALDDAVFKLTSSQKTAVEAELKGNTAFIKATLAMASFSRDLNHCADDAKTAINNGLYTDETAEIIFQRCKQVLNELRQLHQVLPALVQDLDAKARLATWPSYLQPSGVEAFESKVLHSVSAPMHHVPGPDDATEAAGYIANHVADALEMLLSEGSWQPQRHDKLSTTALDSKASESSALIHALTEFIVKIGTLAGTLEEEMHRIYSEFSTQPSKKALASLSVLKL